MYDNPPQSAPLSQGDIIDACPIFALEPGETEPANWHVRGVVLTQACDLAQTKTTRVLIALVHTAADLVKQGVLKAAVVRDQVRRGLVYGWYFLPAAPSPIPLPESIVDLRDLHTLSRSVVEQLIIQGKRVCRLQTPYREHLAQHFTVTYARIALPEPFETQP